MNPTTHHDTEYRIAAVDELDDWQIHEDDTDIRNWDVYTANGEKIGEIESLIADTRTQKVRYAEIELEDNMHGLRDNSYRNSLASDYHVYYGDDDDRHTLVPIGLLRIDHDNEKIIASNNLSNTQFANSPRYAGYKTAKITPPYELVVVRYYGDLEDQDREVYNEKKYDLEAYRTTPYIKESGFYDSDFFSKDRYWNRYQDRRNTMVGFDTGAPKH